MNEQELKKETQRVAKACIDIIEKHKDISIDNEMNVDEVMSIAIQDIEDTFGVE